MELADILETERGARFYRGDLHIHSYSASHDVSDAGTIRLGRSNPDQILKQSTFQGGEDRGEFDWIGDGRDSIPELLRDATDFAKENEAAMKTADIFLANTLKRFQAETGEPDGPPESDRR